MKGNFGGWEGGYVVIWEPDLANLFFSTSYYLPVHIPTSLTFPRQHVTNSGQRMRGEKDYSVFLGFFSFSL